MQGMVSFIGAGPGDPELITVKGRRLIDSADLVLYAGSLVPPALVVDAKPGAAVVDSSGMTLEETHALMREAVLAGKSVARVHTGDPALYGAIREQMALLEAEGLAFQIVPGVTAAFAAAAAGRISLTVPESVQSFSITRLCGRTDVPQNQSVRELAQHGGSLAIYLSASESARLEEELLAGGVSSATRVFIAYRVGWPEERLIWTTVASLAATVAEEKLTRQTVFLILPGECAEAGQISASRLYAGDFSHGFRKCGTKDAGDA